MGNHPRPLDVISRSHNYKSDWVFDFVLKERIPIIRLVGTKKIVFETKTTEGTDYLVAFKINLTRMPHEEAYWTAMEISKRLTNLICLLSGKFTSARMKGYKVSTDIGETSAGVMGNHPLKPEQALSLDLTDNRISRLVSETSEKSLRIAHLANALHASYETPGSAIREIILAFNETLPEESLHLEALRNALSHTRLYKDTIKKLEETMPFRMKLFQGEIDVISPENTGILVMENFHMLHDAIEEFRKQL